MGLQNGSELKKTCGYVLLPGPHYVGNDTYISTHCHIIYQLDLCMYICVTSTAIMGHNYIIEYRGAPFEKRYNTHRK